MLAGGANPQPGQTILVVTRNLPPLQGGMERLIGKAIRHLQTRYIVRVVGPSGCKPLLPDAVSAVELPLRPLPLFLMKALLASFYQAFRYRPATILAGSGLTVPMAWMTARLLGARCAVYLHGLDVEMHHVVYRWLWRPLFRRCDVVIVNSQFTRRLACEAGVDPGRIHIVHPGTELPDLSVARQAREQFRRAHRLGSSPLVLYVGRMSPRKGLQVFVQDIFPRILQLQPDSHLVVVGGEPTAALVHQSGEYDRIRHVLAANGLERSTTFLLEAEDATLHQAYFASDVLIFPLQDRPHDHEGFGMVVLEAAAHGLPSVAFDLGGVSDAIDEGRTGTLIVAGENQRFAEATINYLSQPADLQTRQYRSQFAQGFSWDRFGQGLLEALESASKVVGPART